jgi:hypothetical protein
MPVPRKSNRADELRTVLRLDLVIYAIVIVVCIIALAGLYPGVEIDHMLVSTLITFATGVIGGLFAYLRYKANGYGQDEEESNDGGE